MQKVAYIYETFSLFFILPQIVLWMKWKKCTRKKFFLSPQEKPSSIYEAVGNEKGRKPDGGGGGKGAENAIKSGFGTTSRNSPLSAAAKKSRNCRKISRGMKLHVVCTCRYAIIPFRGGKRKKKPL